MTTPTVEVSQPPKALKADATARVRRMMTSAEDIAKERLRGTRAEQIPARLGKAFDAVLDRCGLVRKSKLASVPTSATAEPQHA